MVPWMMDPSWAILAARGRPARMFSAERPYSTILFARGWEVVGTAGRACVSGSDARGEGEGDGKYGHANHQCMMTDRDWFLVFQLMVTTTEYTEKVARAALQSHAVCCAMTFVGHAWVNYGSLPYGTSRNIPAAAKNRKGKGIGITKQKKTRKEKKRKKWPGKQAGSSETILGANRIDEPMICFIPVRVKDLSRWFIRPEAANPMDQDACSLLQMSSLTVVRNGSPGMIAFSDEALHSPHGDSSPRAQHGAPSLKNPTAEHLISSCPQKLDQTLRSR
ncbi:hypothetical protein C8Q69DRAFT_522277 [Paecilomyces variotii]|uniref:Uncharacterized protein n=1 Tax=Byssochlamys spectabilis TaxID=264951 RepID=A0A443HPZ2_BYSSP|nr:hypothetical protein C8Q69DRAFT_522277 [Paecilomyces variotii]RWQ93871.1 hypothetical protein C8Q69DRAFT_522277 [Paecilomyces variotii]